MKERMNVRRKESTPVTHEHAPKNAYSPSEVKGILLAQLQKAKEAPGEGITTYSAIEALDHELNREGYDLMELIKPDSVYFDCLTYQDRRSVLDAFAALPERVESYDIKKVRELLSDAKDVAHSMIELDRDVHANGPRAGRIQDTVVPLNAGLE